jgi:sensor histidine kinase YesM
VENSIRHGIGPRASGGKIVVRVRREDDMLRIDVEDDGVGPSEKRSREKQRGTGLGLSNTATRLNHLYGDRHTFETGRGQSGGFRVSLSLPLEIDRHAAESTEPEFAELPI